MSKIKSFRIASLPDDHYRGVSITELCESASRSANNSRTMQNDVSRIKRSLVVFKRGIACFRFSRYRLPKYREHFHREHSCGKYEINKLRKTRRNACHKDKNHLQNLDLRSYLIAQNTYIIFLIKLVDLYAPRYSSNISPTLS
jgi:hypothetical protein